MHRRTLFKSLLGLALAPAAAVATTQRRTLLLQESPLAGFQYHSGPTLWPDLRIGQPIDLVREPDNRYDHRAVRIDWNGLKLGYVPCVDNATVSQLLDRGERLTARISRLKESPDPWRRIAFEVHVIA